jgi:hypothetical protein
MTKCFPPFCLAGSNPKSIILGGASLLGTCSSFIKKSAEVRRRCHAVASDVNSDTAMPRVSIESPPTLGGWEDDMVFELVPEEADMPVGLTSGVVRGVSLNRNVILWFDSNHRGFGSGSIIDCRTLIIPWLLSPEEYRGLGDTKSCSIIPVASLKRELVSVSKGADDSRIVLDCCEPRIERSGGVWPHV